MSKFNKLTLKETFKSKDKITIYLLSVILISSLCVSLEYLITTKSFANNKNQTPNNEQKVNYTSEKEITEDKEINNEEITSNTADENALLVSGKINVSTTDITINKTGDSTSGDTTSFYGNNSAILAKDGANLVINNAKITTNATGANGVFSYGGNTSNGTTITINNSLINTEKDNSGGIMTTGGGTMNANNLTITTKGVSSAAIRSDRGGGIVNVTGGTYTTEGQGSPAIYSTASITVKQATLNSKASEGVIIEGKNTITLEEVTLNDNNTKLNGKSTTYKNIFIYQSMSGDAEEGTASFTAKNSQITTNKGDTIYVTNTKAIITLENNHLINNDETGAFLRAQSDSWGNTNNNGGIVELTLNNQEIKGNIIIDKISTLDMELKNHSIFLGAINQENTAKNITLTISKDSKITLTADSYINTLNDEDQTFSNINFNGYKLYVNNKAIN